MTEQGTRGGASPAKAGLADLLSNAGSLPGLGDMLASARRELESPPCEGVAGGGLVRVTLAGDGRLTQVTIAPAVFEQGNASDLEDLVLAAFSNAFEAAQAEQQRRFAALTGFDRPGAAP